MPINLERLSSFTSLPERLNIRAQLLELWRTDLMVIGSAGGPRDEFGMSSPNYVACMGVEVLNSVPVMYGSFTIPSGDLTLEFEADLLDGSGGAGSDKFVEDVTKAGACISDLLSLQRHARKLLTFSSPGFVVRTVSIEIDPEFRDGAITAQVTYVTYRDEPVFLVWSGEWIDSETLSEDGRTTTLAQEEWERVLTLDGNGFMLSPVKVVTA